jgi:hypothetical protein
VNGYPLIPAAVALAFTVAGALRLTQPRARSSRERSATG